MKTNTQSVLITDEQSLVSAKSRFGSPIATYDDGYGQLFIHRDSMGVSGIVRAQTWEDAYSICEDEFFPAASDTWEEMQKEYATEYKSGRELWLHDNPAKTWEDFNALSEAEKDAAYRNGRDVPFAGDITEHACWQEAYGFRPNGARKQDEACPGIYAKDLNGDSLDVLTPELLAQLEITLEIVNQEDAP